MILIRKEIKEIEKGNFCGADNLLKNAPHTHHLLIKEEWPNKYSKKQAFFPLKKQEENKYWPPVSRIDNVFGDRNLICSCPSIDAYEEENT